MITLNETPVRTARNFNINNIKIEKIEAPKSKEKFQNTKITGANATNDVTKCNLKYGVSAELIKEINEKSNVKLKLNIEEKQNNIQIENTFDNKNTNLIDNIEINAEEGTVSNITIKYKSSEDVKSYHNGIIRLNAKENSKVNITIVNLLNTKADNFLSIENNLSENAQVKYTIIDFGGKNSITNYYSNLSRNKLKKYNKHNISRKRRANFRPKLYSRTKRRKIRSRNWRPRSIKR